MVEKIAKFRDVLVARLNLLEEEARFQEADLKEHEGDFRHVTFENEAFIERQILSVERLKKELENLDLDAFETVEQFEQHVLARLKELYDTRPFLRPAVRMVMACVESISDLLQKHHPLW